MKNMFKPLLLLISKLTDFTRLSRSARLMILLHLFYCFADGLSNIFVSVYLWKIEHNLLHVASFYLYQSLAIFLLIPIVGIISKNKSPTFGIGIGTCFLAIFYCCLLLLQDQAIHHIPLLGLLQETGHLFYWTSFHYLSISLTNSSERNLFNGYNEVSGSLANLVSPVIAGGFIISQAGNMGYIFIFFISCLLFVITTIFSAFATVKNGPKQNFAFRPILQVSSNPKKRWFWGMQMMFMQGISDGLFFFLPSVVYFLFFQNEWSLGLITSTLASLTLLSNFFVGRFLPDKKRNLAIFWGTCLHSCVVIPFFFAPSWITVLFFGLGIALAKPWYNIPMLSTIYDFIQQQPTKEEHYIEYLLAREFALGLGRTCSFLLLLGLISHFSKAQDAITWDTLILAIGLPYIWFAVCKFNPQRRQQKNKGNTN